MTSPSPAWHSACRGRNRTVSRRRPSTHEHERWKADALHAASPGIAAATISNIVGVGQSIEPIYRNLYMKSNMSGNFTVISTHLVAELKARGLWDAVMVADLKYFDGSLQPIDRMPGSAGSHGKSAQALIWGRRCSGGRNTSPVPAGGAGGGRIGEMAEASDIERAAGVLRAGGLVAFPTETVYGLGANAEDPAAVTRIFQVKRRPPTHPLIVHIGAGEQLDEWVENVPPVARLLAERFWPGPLTLVLRRGPRVPLEATGGLETVAVRVPDHPVALALLKAFAGGVTAPSANHFGSVSPTTADHVRAGLGADVDYVLDGGPSEVGVESTIVDTTGASPSILRPGGVPREDLEAVLGFQLAVHTTSPIRVSGQHPSHYAPRARVVLVEPDKVVAEADAAHTRGHRVGVLLPAGCGDAPAHPHAVVAVPGTLSAYAHGLYGFLRQLDHQGCDLIIASLPAEDGLGLAIADRLRRAAGPRPSR